MQPQPFIAASAEEAVAQIRAKLGPEAVVLNVRPLPPNGIARLWQKPMIEVLAHLPEAPVAQDAPMSDALAEFRQQLEDIRQQVGNPRNADDETTIATPEEDCFASLHNAGEPSHGQWRAGTMLQRTGLLPLHAQYILDQLRAQYGDVPPGSPGEEIRLARAQLAGLWRAPRTLAPRSLHVLVGPAGSGKTTYLCKWLTQTALVEGRLARTWRLDGATANMAESLSVYCEILGVKIDRAWQAGDSVATEDIGFIDLPGVDWRNPLAIKELGGQIKRIGQPQVHLVLNGAYDVSVLMEQTRAFSALPIEDITVTHLDEETRWGKIWNLVLGTNYAIRHLSTGQNIPGDFREASPEAIFARQFPRK